MAARLALRVLGAAAAVLMAAPAVAPADSGDERLKVMSRNLYVGSTFSHATSATSPAEFIGGVTQVWANVRHNNFPARAEALAGEIARARPHLVGIQEASLWRTQSTYDPTTPATDVAYDYLQILVDELSERGLSYRVATVATTFNVEAPAFGPTGLFELRLTDRDAVLVRDDAPGLTVLDARSGTYAAQTAQPTPLGPIPVPRGWNVVDGELHGKPFRFFNTHLDPDDLAVQEAQAAEILPGPLAGGRPIVAVGDYNSAADGSTTASYATLIEGGLDDAWSAKGHGDGLTCCHAELLHNSELSLESRIDLVLTGNGAKAKSIDVIGDETGDRVDGRWPSDHAGLVAEARLP